MRTRSRQAEILLVEDNPGDVELVQEALQSGTMPNHISVATDGDAAMAFLNRAQGFEKAPRPDLILLDLNIPRKDGFEVLAETKGHPEMSRIPVVVLTSSQSASDILKCYKLHANCFVTKPVDVDEFLATVRSMGEFWLAVAKLPPAYGDGS